MLLWRWGYRSSSPVVLDVCVEVAVAVTVEVGGTTVVGLNVPVAATDVTLRC